MELTLLAILLAVLLVLAAAANQVPRIAVRAASAGTAVLVVLLAVVVLGRSVSTVLPLGPPGSVIHLAIVPLGASFLLLLFATMACAGTAPLRLSATLLCVLAGDAFVLSAGLLLLGGADRLRVPAATAACLIVALALCGPVDDFTALRGVPPEGWRGAAVLILTLAGAGAFCRINPAIAGYLVLRVLFDLCGAGQPAWWGALLLLAGAAIAVVGSVRAALAGTLHAFASAAPLQPFGMAAIALGAALLVRAADLPAAEALALGATWLALVCHVLCRTLLLLIADAAEAGAATRRLDRLGGLIRGMPVTAAACGLSLIAVSALPPGLGFAAFWLLFQSLLAAARIGGALPQIVAVGAAIATALSLGLMVAAGVRLFGAAFLGRPRTPRTAAAEEVTRPQRLVLGGLACVTALLGLFPALALLPAAGSIGAPDTMAFFVLRPGAEAPGYSPLAIAALLAMAGFPLARLAGGAGERRESIWSGGFAAPPAWLPFGDPAAQFGPASFSEPLTRMLAALPSLNPAGHYLRRWCDRAAHVAGVLTAP